MPKHPDKPLGRQYRDPKDTFSAFTVLRQHFSAEFSVGDRVRHKSGMVGAVLNVLPDGVHVSWDNSRSVGIYDDLWFRGHPGWLQHVGAVHGQHASQKSETK